jgi:hypothetical protein
MKHLSRCFAPAVMMGRIAYAVDTYHDGGDRGACRDDRDRRDTDRDGVRRDGPARP